MLRGVTLWTVGAIAICVTWVIGIGLMVNSKVAVGWGMPTLATIYALVWVTTILLVRRYRLGCTKWGPVDVDEVELCIINVGTGLLYLVTLALVPQKYFLFDRWALYLVLGLGLFVTGIAHAIWPRLKWVPEWTREKRKETRG